MQPIPAAITDFRPSDSKSDYDSLMTHKSKLTRRDISYMQIGLHAVSQARPNTIGNTSNTEGFICLMFTVPQKDGGWKPIINLKCLSAYLVVPHFKMEGIGSPKDLLQEDGFMGKIDAYISLIHQEH